LKKWGPLNVYKSKGKKTREEEENRKKGKMKSQKKKKSATDQVMGALLGQKFAAAGSEPQMGRRRPRDAK